MKCEKLAAIEAAFRDIPDFPQPGVIFKDITPVLRDAVLFRDLIGLLAAGIKPGECDCVAGIEARGFILGSAVALALGVGFVPVRKPGKLPCECVREEYTLEYGAGALELHRDAVKPGDRVLLIDDLLATGGSALAAVRLFELLGAEIIGIRFVMELGFLKGNERLAAYPIRSLIRL